MMIRLKFVLYLDNEYFMIQTICVECRSYLRTANRLSHLDREDPFSEYSIAQISKLSKYIPMDLLTLTLVTFWLLPGALSTPIMSSYIFVLLWEGLAFRLRTSSPEGRLGQE